MGWIVCATRGAAGSRANQTRAIELARAGEHQLTFLAVADTRPYGILEEELRAALEDELSWVGRALLEIAAERARAAGVDSETVLRRGEALQEISRFVREVDAERVLIGAPREALPLPPDDDPVERFSAELERLSGAHVEVVYAQPVAGTTSEAHDAPHSSEAQEHT